MTREEIILLIETLGTQLGPGNGIEDVSGFIDALIAIASYESNFDPAAVGADGEIGLFQFHPGGEGASFAAEDQADPDAQIRHAISYLAPFWDDNDTFDNNLWRMIDEGQRPYDSNAAYDAASGYAHQTEAQRLAGIPASALPQAAGGGDPNDPSSWSPGNIVSIVAALGAQIAANPEDYALALQMDQAISVLQNYRQAGLLDEDTSGYTAEEVESQRLANLQSRINLGLYGYDEETRRQQQYFENELAAGNLSLDQAIARFNAWRETQAEARTRAEAVYGEEERRAVWSGPTEAFPMRGPGSASEALHAEYDLPFTPSTGTPMGDMPNLEDYYAQYQQSLGVSPTAPGIPQGVPQGPSAQVPSGVQQYLQEILRRAGVRQANVGAAA